MVHTRKRAVSHAFLSALRDKTANYVSRETNKVNLAVFPLVKCCLSARSSWVSTAFEVHFDFLDFDKTL